MSELEPWEMTPEEIGTEYGKWIKDDGDIYSFDVWVARAAAVHALEYMFNWIDSNANRGYIYEGTYAYDTKADNQLFIDLGDYEQFKLAALKAGR